MLLIRLKKYGQAACLLRESETLLKPDDFNYLATTFKPILDKKKRDRATQSSKKPNTQTRPSLVVIQGRKQA